MHVLASDSLDSSVYIYRQLLDHLFIYLSVCLYLCLSVYILIMLW